MFNLILASASPRRSELLRQMGVAFRVHPADVDESRFDAEPIESYVQRVSHDKAAVVAALGEQPVLGADTAVTIDSELLAKPRDLNEARAMLTRLSGRTHRVHTGVTLLSGDFCKTILSSTAVTFDRLSDWECEAYLRSGEWEGKAGGYAIQGLAARFVTRVEGSYSAVVGLPIWETYVLLKEAGLEGGHGQ